MIADSSLVCAGNSGKIAYFSTTACILGAKESKKDSENLREQQFYMSFSYNPTWHFVRQVHVGEGLEPWFRDRTGSLEPRCSARAAASATLHGVVSYSSEGMFSALCRLGHLRRFVKL